MSTNTRITSLVTMAFTITALVVLLTILAALVVGLSHHKKANARTRNLMGARGVVVSTLDPEGAVIVDGDLWRARTENASPLQTQSRIRVVGLERHLVLVEPVSDKS